MDRRAGHQSNTQNREIKKSDETTSFGISTFENCTSLLDFDLPLELLNLSDSTFKACIKLTTLSIPDKLQEIASSAYANCTGLINLNLEDGEVLNKINSNAFNGCTGLIEVVIPNTITSIGEASFGNCVNLQKISLPFTGNNINATTGSARLFGYIFGTTEKEGLIATNQKYNDDYNYWRNYYIPSKLTEVTITLDAEIPSYAFVNCVNLKKVNLLDETTSLGNSTFENCTSLLDFDLPYSLITIGDSTFKNCTTLSKITISNNITTIGNNVYSDCINITEINLVDKNVLTKIGDNAFMNCIGLTEVTIPNTVTSIGSSILENCINLTKYTAPFIGANEITANGDGRLLGYLFGRTEYDKTTPVIQVYSNDYGYTRTFFIPTKLSEIEITKDTDLAAFMFQNCVMLEKVEMLTTVTNIDNSTFMGCTSLKDFDLPSDLITIGANAFKNCTSLTTITNPDNLTTIGDSAYESCTSLVNLNLIDNKALVKISSNAFKNCTGLTEVTIPNTVTSMGSSILENCINLTKYTAPFIGANEITANGDGRLLGYLFGRTEYDKTTPVIQVYSNDYGYTRTFFIPTKLSEIEITKDTDLAAFMFQNCVMLEKVEMLTTVTNIDNSTFMGCTSLKDFDLPSDLITIGANAFKNCTSLTTITNPDNLTTIGDSAYEGCTSLINLNLIDNKALVKISSNAFKNCTGLTEVTIPNTVISIGSAVLAECVNLTKISSPFIGANEITANGDGRLLGYMFGRTEKEGLSLITQTYSNDYGYTTTYYIPVKLSEIIITKDLSLADYMFQNCNMLQTIRILDYTVTASTTFAGCNVNIIRG